MTGLRMQISARSAFRAVLAAGLLVMLGANLPGHLSYDSVAQLYEGHFHIRETWGPALYAWILGVFDGIIPGTALYVTASAVLFYASLASLSDLRPRTHWLAVAVAAPIMLIPQVIIYQAIVWKDVAFANTAVGGLVCLAHAAKAWPNPRRRWLFLTGAVVLLPGCSSAARASRRASSSSRSPATTATSTSPTSPPAPGVTTGLRIVQNCDLIGAAALDPTYPLEDMAAAAPADTALIRERAHFDYSGRRVDFIDRDKALSDALWRVPDGAAQKQWVDLILKNPALYLRVRWEDFRWVLAPPVIDWCLPVYVGVDAPIEKMAPLRLDHRFVQSGLQLGGAGFAASFFIISIACDYRYLYFTDLAALAGLIYAAIDPPMPPRKAA